MSPQVRFSDHLRNHRTNMAWTQEDLAKNWGFSTSTVSAWEREKRVPRRTEFPRIASLLEIELETLVLSIRVSSINVYENKNQDGNLVESQQSNPVTAFPNQKECESQIRAASIHAREVKILTIRGEKYFVGSMSLLSHFFSAEQKVDSTIKVLVLSPESQHVTEDLAAQLKHGSAEDIQEKMRLALTHLKILARRNLNLVVRCYEQQPNFKLLLFDNILFVSAYISSKNDDNAAMFKLTREGNPLFVGFERLFDELWKDSTHPW
jgi:transcriptional regulator with XRE-family HTH domain